VAVPYRVGGSHNVSELPNFEHAGHPFGQVKGDTRTREELHAMGNPADYLDRGVVVQPMYYYMGHISRHVRPGSRAIHAIVDDCESGPQSRTFRQTVGDTIVAGGGINDVARVGVEATLWPCEGSTRQEWLLNDEDKLQVFGHDYLGKPTTSCLGHEPDKAFKGLLLTECDKAGIFKMQTLNETAGTVNAIVENADLAVGENCLVASPLEANGGAYGPRGGAQVRVGKCDQPSAAWKFRNKTGELISTFFEDYGGDTCLTTGWPFLQIGAFVDRNNGNEKKTMIVLNEAEDPANYIIRNGDGQIVMTNSIPGHSIQTVVL